MQNIYFFIGTKAQAIKCISLLNVLSHDHNLSVVIVDSGQHAQITENIFKNLNNQIKFLNLHSNEKNISKYFQGIIWFCKFIFKNLIFRSLEKENKSTQDICVVHGDTASTLMGLFWGKRNNCKVLHLESGLTSSSLFNPFPEEIIRKITSKFSDILICFDPESYNRLSNNFKRKFVLEVSENTVLETLGEKSDENNVKKNLVTATLHRTENILSKKRLLAFIELIEMLSEKFDVNWYLHEPTMNSIKKFNLQISNKVNLYDLLEHEDFINQLRCSKIVVTDGGSIQEECFYLGNTTVIWRDRTERPYALNENMLVSYFNVKNSYEFVMNNLNKRIPFPQKKSAPSKEIYNFLKYKKLIN